MARVGSGDSLDIGTWAQGDNPGAGHQDFTNFGGTGLNANFIRFWRAIKTALKADGTMNNDVVDGAQIKASAVDGSTLDTNNPTGTKVLRVKDLGITTAKLANDSVDNTKLKDDAAVDANRAVTTDHIRDGAVTNAKLATNAVTAVKITDATITAKKNTNASRALGWHVIFTSEKVAGTAVGNTAAAIDEWQETNTVYQTKVRGVLPHMKDHIETGKNYYLKAVASAKASAASGWKAQLTVGGSSTAVTGINTSYDVLADGTREFIARVLISDGTAIAKDGTAAWSVELGSQAGATAFLTNLTVSIVVED